MPQLPIKRALLSVSDKSGLEDLALALDERGVSLYATGGTATFLDAHGFSITEVETVTQFPEMLGGRVKTLHPRIFGGILARREEPKDMEECRRFELPLFDLVVVNLYPFWDHLGKTTDEQSSFIDVGGPSMIRAAAKNHRAVTVLSSPQDYKAFLAEYRETGGTSLGFRKTCAAKTFGRTAEYDAMIASAWTATDGAAEALPKTVELSPQEPLRYGENPHQSAVYVRTEKAGWKVLQGKELSYNNLLDAEAALRLANEFTTPAVAIVKHNSPCGVATGNEHDTLAKVFDRAWNADAKSAFGGIVATNRPVDDATATGIAAGFVEVVIAPSFSEGAKATLAAKKNLRLIEWAKPQSAGFEVRPSLGGWLLQAEDKSSSLGKAQTVTSNPLSGNARADLEFAWKVVKHAKSNAIVIAKDGVTLGIGSGQTSRVDAMESAIAKAKAKGALTGAVVASDAFFPFRDNVDAMKGLGIAAIVQPGGSQRDQEVISACDEAGIAMLFTGERHFRH